MKNRAENFFPPQLMTHCCCTSCALPSLSCPPRTQAVLETVDISIEITLCHANETTSSCCDAICYILRRELPTYTWSTSTAISLNCIYNSWLPSISNRTTLNFRILQKKKEQKKNLCISYLERRLFWNHNCGSAAANPDVDGFKIIVQRNTAATLIHLPTLILQVLIWVSMLGIWCLYLSKESKESRPRVDGEL